VALVVLRERLRPDAAEIVRYFEQQGVQLCVLSGDDPQTVAAIAREVGLPVALESAPRRPAQWPTSFFSTARSRGFQESSRKADG
jgi:cation transport ATPase